MDIVIPTKFLCTNCMKPLTLVRITATTEMEIIGVDVCGCKGDPSKGIKAESNVVSFQLEKERIKLKKGVKK